MFLMTLTLFILGLLTFITGVLILTFRASGKQVATLANQTTRLAQKGLAEDVAGLVGNASSLMDAMNQLVRTTAGVGVFLTTLGLVLMVVASLIGLKIF
jgi:hypothetical protein